MNVLLLLFLSAVKCTKLQTQFVDKKSEHSGEKKQFVNMGMFGGGGFEGGFGGGSLEGGFNGGFNGGMEFNENNMGGLNLQNNGMDGGMMFGGQQFGSLGSLGGGGMAGADGMSELGGGGDGFNSLQQFSANNNDQGGFGNQGGFGTENMALGYGQEQNPNRGESLFNSLSDDNEGDSLYGINSLEGNYENNVNLGDSMNPTGLGQYDINNFEGLGGKGNSASSSPNGHGSHFNKNNHKIGDDRQGIGEGTGDMLSNELGQLDSSDEKLQKMLESGLSGDTFDENNNNNSPENSLSALLNPQSALDQMDSQPSTSADELPNLFQQNPGSVAGSASTPADITQMANSLSQSGLGSITPITVHAHASDKPDKTPSSSDESRQAAEQVQETASKQHRTKLCKLKNRLKLLKEKLNQLEEEQAKKSTSNKSNDPKTARNDAIKKLLIKNLKLAAMIASKEIQLEEAKGRGLAYLSGKKEQDSELFGGINHDKSETSIPGKTKPLTELSKKAEEEVNHLSRNPDLDKSKNNTHIKFPEDEKVNRTFPSEGSNSFLKKINETLQVLDHTTPEVHTRSTLTLSSRRFLRKLQKQIQSMSPDQAQIMEERALTTLYRAIKNKATKKDTIHSNETRT